MKLKMPNKFNAKLVKNKLLEEDQFISNIFSKMPLPVNELVAQNGHEPLEANWNSIKKDKSFSKSGDKTDRAQNFEELHAKFNELKGKKLSYKEKLVKKGLKNRMSKKSKKEGRLMKKKLVRTERVATESSKIKNDPDALELPKAPKQKPIFNSQGNMVFSKFDFSEIGTKKKLTKIEKDPKKILLQLEEKKKKIKELEEAGEKEKAEEYKEKEAWKAALAKAVGEKVKDDPELLKRTIKREEQKKKRSQKKWDARKDKTQGVIQDRQQKRMENIQKRKKEVKTNKLKKAAKKGRIIPGF
ncbi:surfeit locus protein 6 homolog [Phymastichus coffea]|uniref:surfeit locus protein 6 homolog n=1 Tax=Phymastichus coffea TaxID=108790 RepID=UPI00273B4667|nr:surfeit locus protein 6 homolog [Phymastichus coffea]